MKNLSDYLKASLCTTAFSTALLAPIGAQANDNSVVVRGTGMSVAEAIEQIEKSTDYTFSTKKVILVLFLRMILTLTAISMKCWRPCLMEMASIM